MPEKSKPSAAELLAQADAGYMPIVGFDEWAASASLEPGRWEELVARLEHEKESSSAEKLKAARSVVSRVAAIETGAIEKLYELDAGFTLNVAYQTAVAGEALLEAVEAPRRNLIQSQMEGYEFVIDLVTGSAPLAQAWVRQLHAKICGAQETYRVLTPQGWIEKDLPKGEYKEQPNHVLQPDGSLHAYCPVPQTQSEMALLVEELGRSAFEASHPALQAAYTHHSLTRIHPFPDGNGRVARALASVFTYRAASVPALIFSERRAEYIQALKEADERRPSLFTNLMRRGVEDAIELVLEALRTAVSPTVSDLSDAIAGLYTTPAGFSHAEVDQACELLLKAAGSAMEEELAEFQTEQIEVSHDLARNQDDGAAFREGYRPPAGRELNTLIFRMKTAAPANAGLEKSMRLEVPRECELESPIYLHSPTAGLEFQVPAREVIPILTEKARMRLRMFIKRAVSETGQELLSKARSSFKRSGY